MFRFLQILILLFTTRLSPSLSLSTRFTRRQVIILTTGLTSLPQIANAQDDNNIINLLSQLETARQQLDQVPPLITSEKWDSIRAILIRPPLSDCWAKTNRPLIGQFAEAVGEAGGEELEALEAREELVSHLRYLDMAVYNNVFNPITVEGKSGATKELVRSYYEDPMNEWKASVAAMESLIRLGKGL